MRRPHPLRLAAEEDQPYQQAETEFAGIRGGGGGGRPKTSSTPSGEVNLDPEKVYDYLATAVDASISGLDSVALAQAIREAGMVEAKLARRLVLRATFLAQDAGAASVETLRRALQELVDERRKPQNPPQP